MVAGIAIVVAYFKFVRLQAAMSLNGEFGALANSEDASENMADFKKQLLVMANFYSGF